MLAMAGKRLSVALAVLSAAVLLAQPACSKEGEANAGDSRAAAAPTAKAAPQPLAAAQPGPTKAPPPKAAPMPPPAGGRAPTVVLLDPGKGPRKPLRYDLPGAYKDKIKMTMTMAMDMNMGPGQSMKMQLPPIYMEMELSVVEKLGNDEMRCKFAVTGADVLPGGDKLFEAMRDQLKAELNKVVGAAGTMIMNNRGVTRDMNLALPSNMDPNMRQTMESSRQAMEQMSSPLPVEPVGIGARWQVDQRIEQNGLVLKQKAVFQLSKLKGKKGALKTTITQTADPQTAKLPNLPAGFTAQLLSHSGTGGGKVDLDLGRLVPSRANVDIKTDTSIKVTGQGQDQSMQMKADTKVDIGRL